MNRLISAFFVSLFILGVSAQKPCYGKLSPMLRRMVMKEAGRLAEKKFSEERRQGAQGGKDTRTVCAFIQISGDAGQVLAENECEPLFQSDDIFIAHIPISRLASLTRDARVKRIEAERGNRLTLDSTALHVNAVPVYAGEALPQAYTGAGVVMGVMDVGFDLTHPNFYDSSTEDYRIRAFWDQLSADRNGGLPVGAEYTTKEQLLGYAHSRDGLIQTHGTHTLGIAAGSGYNTNYRGIAYESDICLVSNAVVQDTVFINDDDLDKFTYAMDALGFKYIFDYAASQGKPCVISFSEGSEQDFWGNDNLYYQMLEKLTGPGRIIVASAGNESNHKTYFVKEQGEPSKGSFLYAGGKMADFTLKASADALFSLRFTLYDANGERGHFLVPVSEILAAPDSSYNGSFDVDARHYEVSAQAYPSAYTSAETCFDVRVESPVSIGASVFMSFEIVGEPRVEWFKGTGYLVTNALSPLLNAGETTHNILSPSSAPCVICVGANSYRTGMRNDKGNNYVYNQGTDGELASYSSVGPTFDDRTKPDVVAPGTNIISSFSSYFMEANPHSWEAENTQVAHFDFQGRTYGWYGNSGTSMSAPVVGGTVALWLQAKPDLTGQEVLDILSRTCSRKDASLSYPNNYYGYGEIDAYRGLLDILGIDGINGISASQPSSVRVRPAGNGRVLFLFDAPAVRDFSVTVYTSGGSLLDCRQFPGGQKRYEMVLGSTAPGVYVIQLTGSEAGVTGSTLIRM